MFLFLTVLQALVGAALVGIILMQKSEGGGLVSGGNPSGLMSARGAADFMTRATTLLAIAFVSLSIVLAVLAAGLGSASDLDESFDRDAAVEALDPEAGAEDGLPPVDPQSILGPQSGEEALVDPLAPGQPVDSEAETTE